MSHNLLFCGELFMTRYTKYINQPLGGADRKTAQTFPLLRANCWKRQDAKLQGPPVFAKVRQGQPVTKGLSGYKA
jgi:hypothetical protein